MDDEEDDISPLEQEDIEKEVTALEAQLNDASSSVSLVLERGGYDKEAASKREAEMDPKFHGVRLKGRMVKTVAPILAGAIPKIGVGITQSLAGLRGVNTVNVISALGSLKSLSGPAQEDVDFILYNQRKKVAKVVASSVASGIDAAAPSPIPFATLAVKGGSMLRNAGKRLAGTQGAKRKAVAERILAGVQKDPVDRSYLAIVYALFINKPNPGAWVQNFYASGNRDLALNLLMAKIASK